MTQGKWTFLEAHPPRFLTRLGSTKPQNALSLRFSVLGPLSLVKMSGSIFPVINRVPLTGWDAPTMSATNRTDSSPIRVKTSPDALIDTRQSEMEKYLAYLSQVEGQKADGIHQGAGSTIDALPLAETFTGISWHAEAANILERPHFYSDYDLYAMDSPFLREVYMVYEEPDYEALYEALLRRQTLGSFKACAILHQGLWENGAAIFADVRDPRSCMPISLRLTLVTEINITYTEEELDFFVDRNHHLRTNVPGIFANLEFGNEYQCSSEGKFLMSRCWAKTQPDGLVVELFEGYMEFKVDNGMYFLGRRGEDINLVQHAFWAIRHEI
ncbi:hypothetical protein IW262DRAFT_335054 [Armillaria fumosa]|nr:hypothetical protein IW262DRAFT_335054 [Armillaria fumosa]